MLPRPTGATLSDSRFPYTKLCRAGVDWPIGYVDIAPFCDRFALMIGVNGGRIELENHPDSSPGCLMPPPKPRSPEMLLDATCESMGIPVRAAHTAVLTRDMPDDVAPRSACFNATDRKSTRLNSSH